MGKRKILKEKTNTDKRQDIYESVEKAILNANLKIKNEDYANSKVFIDWMGTILILLILLFIGVVVAIGYVAVRLLISNLQNGIYFSWLNLDFLGIIFVAILMTNHTYKVKKHIDDIKSVSDLTGISSFIISCFALLISLLAILMKA